MAKIQIRFNTKYLEGDPRMKWRLLIDGKEFLAQDIKINVPSFTTEDIIETGEMKWHLSCVGEVVWQGAVATVVKG